MTGRTDKASLEMCTRRGAAPAAAADARAQTCR
jgi:hypothetical protein